MSPPTLLILAAGLGKRFGGNKQTCKIGPAGEAIIDYSIYDAIRAGFAKVVIVVRQSMADEFEKTIGRRWHTKTQLQYVFQEPDNLPKGFSIPEGRIKPWGTAHAIMVAEKAIHEPFMVINADDFYGRETFETIASYLKSNTNHQQHCMAAFELKNTLSDHGPVSRGICLCDNNMHLKTITEITQIARNEITVGYMDDHKNWLPLDENTPVSMNAWGFYPGIFGTLHRGFGKFLRKCSNPLHDEYFISYPLNSMIARQEGSIKVLRTSARWFGLTYPGDRQPAMQQLHQLIAAGEYPSDLFT
ncbi:MAG: NTP transferase domain-containing protein [Bacteroidetes bacterium]|nr:NTP transferase domain-containing protein [Bacteroidota bacterium]